MQKIYFEIRKTRGETRKDKEVFPGCTTQLGTACFDTEKPKLVGKFETLEEAKIELKKYSSSAYYSNGTWDIEEYSIREIAYEVDENGKETEDFDYGGGVYAVAEYKNSESDIEEILGMTLAEFNASF